VAAKYVRAVPMKLYCLILEDSYDIVTNQYAVHLFDIEFGQTVGKYIHKEFRIISLQVLFTPNCFVTITEEKEIYLWKLEDLNSFQTLPKDYAPNPSLFIDFSSKEEKSKLSTAVHPLGLEFAVSSTGPYKYSQQHQSIKFYYIGSADKVHQNFA
jgi:WD40 repeat protein